LSKNPKRKEATKKEGGRGKRKKGRRHSRPSGDGRLYTLERKKGGRKAGRGGKGLAKRGGTDWPAAGTRGGGSTHLCRAPETGDGFNTRKRVVRTSLK